MSKLQPALRIKGENVRRFRKLRGLSQAELASGICTQATISLIEKRNKVPSMNILVRLVNRLGITLEDIVVENQDRIQQALSAVDQKVRRGEYRDAAGLLKKVNARRLTREQDLRNYNYFSGMSELFVTQDLDEAIYYFGRVLNGASAAAADVAGIMATLGLALAYAEKGTTERARVYVEQAISLFNAQPLNEQRYLDVELTIYWHISRIYFELGDDAATLQHVQSDIAIGVRNESLFLLPELYALQARTQARLEDEQAAQSRAIALALARVTDRTSLIADLVQGETAASA
ncbi:helix-turn-helix domain-containing protein [Lacticaseibacillus camelliae]|uniref:XRE family transcriptional regulator n=1 Tax=Lacticaseibacillus camelliae DSM 22697 = JCM 13995 TaxID=1423730 RepID=A0A0R2F9T6_9LACO|nr:helix-turn-helix transcriptional regulator [Lacticaseibacillus camelliae]KRN25081.1 XRE family transcriptional regulator [Lacticaseibacillus camelliae DSM 22697 = JCM 13995]